MAKKTILDIEPKGKKVLLRVDFNVPLKDGVITNDNRIVAALPTIQNLVDRGARLILFSHLGKVKTEEDKKTKTLAPVAKRLSELMNKDVKFVANTRGEELEQAINNLKDGELLLFENTRFEAGETKCDDELGKYWASLGDLFVNDAFGTAHRAHASNVGISKYLPAVTGYLMQKEVENLDAVVKNPDRPFVAVLGGAKVSDKIAVIENLIEIADTILIGGGMMFTFLKAMGKNIGKSLLEEDRLELAKELIKKAEAKGKKLVLPIDLVAAKEFSNDSEYRMCSVDEIAEDEMGLDIGDKTIELFKGYLKDAKTIVWNGPMGVFEMSNFEKGTKSICQYMSELKDAKTVIGGGDSAAAAIQFGFSDKDFSHISTGGGASLEYLEGKELPGVAYIQDK